MEKIACNWTNQFSEEYDIEGLIKKINSGNLLLYFEEGLKDWSFPIILKVNKGSIENDLNFQISMVDSFEKQIQTNLEYLKQLSQNF